MKRLFLASFLLASTSVHAQMVAPLTILHGDDYGVGGSWNNMLSVSHMGYSNDLVMFQGDITAVDPYMLDYKIKTNGYNVTTISINSMGGSTQAAFQLADMIRSRNWNTIAETCYSACVVVWSAGRSKVVHGALGVHQAFNSLEFGNHPNMSLQDM